MIAVEQDRRLSEYRAGLCGGGDDHFALNIFDPSLDQHIELSGPLAFAQQEIARSKQFLRATDAIIENSLHG